MCVIVHKERNVDIPKKNILKACFEANPHGSGILLWRQNSNIAEIYKGFMTFDAFYDIFQSLMIKKEDECILHFRITTAGGTCKENCHPFPISNDINEIKALRINTTKALVHNGIIGRGTDNLSDTQLFVMDVLASSDVIYNNLDDESIQKMIENFTPGNRYIIVDTEKNLVKRLGSGWYQNPDNKLYFSNRLFENKLIENKKNTFNGFYSKINNNKSQNSLSNLLIDFSKKPTFIYESDNNKNNNEFLYNDDDDEFLDYYLTDICPVCNQKQDLLEIEMNELYYCLNCKSLIHFSNDSYFDTKEKKWIKNK